MELAARDSRPRLHFLHTRSTAQRRASVDRRLRPLSRASDSAAIRLRKAAAAVQLRPVRSFTPRIRVPVSLVFEQSSWSAWTSTRVDIHTLARPPVCLTDPLLWFHVCLFVCHRASRFIRGESRAVECVN